jgi:hypothetical protein
MRVRVAGFCPVALHLTVWSGRAPPCARSTFSKIHVKGSPEAMSSTITVCPFYSSRADIKPSRYLPPWWAFCPPSVAELDAVYRLGYALPIPLPLLTRVSPPLCTGHTNTSRTPHAVVGLVRIAIRAGDELTVSRRPRNPSNTTVARTEGYTYAAKVWALCASFKGRSLSPRGQPYTIRFARKESV